jgi:radical SAM protein with 4Fe4S-binding SPASM domain
MAPHDVLWVLQEFSQAQGLRVLLTGGEPLRHSQFWQINAQLPKFSLRKVLFTNGLLLDEPTAKALNVQEVQISLDGLRDSHEALRGPGTFGKALRAIEAARAAGLEVSVATMAHSGNLHELPALECLLRDLGVSTWSVDVPVLTRGAAKTLVPPPERAGKALAFGFGKRASHGSQEGYACGLNLMSVSAKGEAARCSFYRPVGNVLKEGLLPCWQRIRPLRLSELRCRHCPHLQQCRGGCRYRAESLGQDPLSKDLYRCALYGIIQK